MNKKGFVLTETLMVAVFIITIFTFIYTSVIPLLGLYKDKSIREKNIDIVYKLNHIRRMIKKDANQNTITSNNVKVITCNDLSNKNNCNNLMNYMDLEQYTLVYTKSIKNNINSIKNINDEISKYITAYSNEDKESLILLDNIQHTIVHLNYSTQNIMGSIPSNILDYKSDIIEIKFVKEDTLTINGKYRNIDANKKANITSGNNGRVLAWLEEDTNDNTKYVLYIESNDVIYLQNGIKFDDFSNVTSISFDNINTSMMTNMSDMFSGCSSLISLDLSSFNTTNVTTMARMFYDCSSLANLNLSSFNTTNVTNMSSLFSECHSLVSLDLSNFNTTNVTDMSGMFYNCIILANLNLSSFNTTNVTTMASMFYDCCYLTSLNLSNFTTTSVTTMANMFTNCKRLVSLDLSNFNTTNVTDMSSMFSFCDNLTNLNLSSFNTTNVTSMTNMFFSNGSLVSLDLSSFNTANVTSMASMFASCTNLTTIYVLVFNTNKVNNSSGMFSSASSLVGGNGTVYTSAHTDKTYARIDAASTPGYFTLKT